MKKQSRMWLHLLCSIILLAGLTACSSSEGDANGESEPIKPTEPISDGDWQTISTDGGTIEKDDITVIFPSGTFSEDSKVAITETSAIGSARSKFYQVTLPKIGTNKSFTIKLKCEGSTNEVHAVVNTPGWNRNTGDIINMNFDLEPINSDGELSFDIPEIDSNGDDIPFFSIGLADCPLEVSTTRAGTTPDYWVTVDPKDFDDLLNNMKEYKKLIAETGKHIPPAYKILMDDLKFQYPSDQRSLRYILSKDKDAVGGTWGVFIPSLFCRDWSYVYLNDARFRNYMNSPSTDLLNQLQATVLHETLHAFTYYSYDSQARNFIIIRGLLGDMWAEFDEAVGCWVEKFTGAKVLSENTVAWQGNFIYEFFPHEWGQIATRDCGYGMATFIEFLARKTSNQSIVKIFEALKSGKTDFRAVLKEFLDENNIPFFDAESYYDFAFSVMNNTFDPQITIRNTIYDLTNNTADLNKEEISLKGDVYNFGVLIQRVWIDKDFMKANTKSFIKIAQNNDGVLTRVYYPNYPKENDLVLIGESKNGESANINVDNFLETVKATEGTPIIYLATTRIENKEDFSSLPSDITIKIAKEVEPNDARLSRDSVVFDWEGGYEEVKIYKGSYKYCDVDVPREFDGWLKAQCSEDGTVTIGTFTNYGEELKGYVNCWVSNNASPGDAAKKIMPLRVIQKAGENAEETLLDVTDLVFPVEGGAKTIKYSFGEYQWMSRDWDDDTWLRTSWSKDYLSAIAYNPTNDNRFANELYVCAFPNETGVERTQKIRFGYTNEKGQDFDKRKIYTVNVLQEGGAFNMDMMKNLFVGTWYTPQDIIYTNGDYYHRRYTFRADNTFVFEGQTTSSTSKPASWVVEATGTYSVRDYKVGGDRVSIHIEIPVPGEGIYYLALIEVFPHYLFFAYENTDGSLRHSVYMERE